MTNATQAVPYSFDWKEALALNDMNLLHSTQKSYHGCIAVMAGLKSMGKIDPKMDMIIISFCNEVFDILDQSYHDVSSISTRFLH
jgi:hypothetical protein